MTIHIDADFDSGNIDLLSRDGSTASLARFSPDGLRVALVIDGTVKILPLDQSATVITISHSDAIEDICFSPDGQRIATASRDRTARVWDAVSGGSQANFFC